MPEQIIQCSDRITLLCPCEERVVLLGPLDEWFEDAQPEFSCECGRLLSFADALSGG